ncbi:ABC transporter ATP-binding protein [Paenibacillus psychroresistens]|uniref:ABC transporter ATP-binding protein n=1 Tax=Paenibacillus psychroresistens TaxID=1778678 RepID=A0A6B8RH68_9BACL|nr:ABC-F type ribosomal protection protein [Paenibacillus psychroresistens]QGQ94892.1 ABC transporter ATP-binding protein [Paenibacillus psychroresistens]
MTLINIRGIKKSYGDLAVLENIHFDIRKDERIGLVGMNGAGKTTLANLIFGSLAQDGGAITFHRQQLKIGYLQQSTSYSVNTFCNMIDPEDSTIKANRFLEFSSHLGLNKVQDWDSQRFSGLSGGEKTKLAIAHIWASKPDMLILDEPTNHLDFQGVEWLIKELKTYGAATMIISHDRYFLDHTVERIIELENGRSLSYPGNYTFYREEKLRRYQSQLHQFEEQQKYEHKIEAEITRLKNWSNKAHREAGKVGKMAEMRAGVKEFYRSKAKKMDQQVKSRIKRLEKIESEGVMKPKEENKVEFEWSSPEKRGRRLIEAKQLTKSFGYRTLFQESSFYIQRGDRIGLLGPNGCGKTTLLQMILGREPIDSGQLWVSPSAQIAYLTQDVSGLDPQRSVLELLQGAHVDPMQVGKARTLLANMGFDESMLIKPIQQLSLGERTRIKLAQLLMQDQDLLILDEPTNHLDLTSREQLEDTLSTYNGTLMIVSHDRYFLEKTCDKLLIFADGKIQRFERGFAEYKEKIEQQKSAPLANREDIHEQKMIIENRMAYLLGELNKYSSADSQYVALDMEFKRLVEMKKQISTK